MSLSDKWRALGLPWMPGMLDTKGRRVIGCGPGWVNWVDVSRVCRSLPSGHCPVDQWHASTAPDWDDPATLGCLLQQVRDAYGPKAYIDIYMSNAGTVTVTVWAPSAGDYEAPTLAGALIAALEAAQGEG